MADIPSRLPHPDETQRIRSASNRLTVARKDMVKAYVNDFLREGIVPDNAHRIDMRGDSMRKKRGGAQPSS